MGMVFQQFNLFPHMNVLDNVTLAPRVVHRRNRKEAEDKGRDLLARVGLADKAAAYPDKLSGGQQQRVAIARSLVNNPAIVWADEPTGALDSHTADDIISLLRALNMQSGLTTVIVTHDQTVGDRCDRIVRMRDGLIEPAPATAVVRDRFAPVGVTRETYQPVEALAV